MMMARASEADLQMAVELCKSLEAINGRWGATMPESIARAEGKSGVEAFDPDDPEQCKRVVAHLCELSSQASLMRVVWGMVFVLDPANKLVDPEADTLRPHPDSVRALAAMSRAGA